MSSFASLRKKSAGIDQLQKKFESLKTNNFSNQIEDETYWTMKHLRGEDGTGKAVIRLLPAPPDGNGGQENDPFVYFYEYFAMRNGKVYNNRSRQTIDGKDPAYEYNGTVFQKYKSKEERQKHLLQRNVKYFYNILVISDPNRPENEGKVFRWAIGPQIHKVIESAIFPEFGEDPINVFDPIEGANLEIRVYTKKIPGRDGGMVDVPSYEKSKFLTPSQLMDLEEFDEVWNKQYSLAEIVAPDQFKSYEDLKADFNRVFGDSPEQEETDDFDSVLESKIANIGKNSTAKMEPEEDVDDDIPWENPTEEERSKATSKPKAKKEETESVDDWLDSLRK